MDKNKVVVITGANSGIGKATALAKAGATVVMLSRNLARGEEALREVREKSSSDSVHLMLCDLASVKSVEEFCSKFRQHFQRLDVLINNAGVILPGRHLTQEGFELQFGVNHLGHFLLTNRLLDMIIASAPARIINVSSGAHKAGRIYFDDVNLTKNFSMFRAYGQSKLANILFTIELAERLQGTGVSVNSLHPGFVGTGIGVNRETGFGRLISKMLTFISLPPEQGAETSVYLAATPEVEGVTGQYFYKKKPTATSGQAQDRGAAKRLWTLSEKMLGIKSPVQLAGKNQQPLRVRAWSVKKWIC